MHVCGRRLDPDERRLNVELPADPHEGVSLFHQEAVAEIGGGHRVLAATRTSIKASEQSLASAIGDLEQERAVAFLCFNWSKDVQVGGEVDAPVGRAGRVLEIDDSLVVLVCRIESELDRAGELLVRTNLTERLASGDNRAIGDRHLGDFGTRVRCDRQSTCEECEEPT